MTANWAVFLWALPHNRLHLSLGGLLLLCFPYVLWLVVQAFGGWAVFAIVLVGLSRYRLLLVYYIKKVLGRHEPDR